LSALNERSFARETLKLIKKNGGTIILACQYKFYWLCFDINGSNQPTNRFLIGMKRKINKGWSFSRIFQKHLTSNKDLMFKFNSTLLIFQPGLQKNQQGTLSQGNSKL